MISEDDGSESSYEERKYAMQARNRGAFFNKK